jgi:hypothetical protein
VPIFLNPLGHLYFANFLVCYDREFIFSIAAEHRINVIVIRPSRIEYISIRIKLDELLCVNSLIHLGLDILGDYVTLIECENACFVRFTLMRLSARLSPQDCERRLIQAIYYSLPLISQSFGYGSMNFRRRGR